MAKTSAIVRNERRRKLSAKHFVKRKELVAIVKNPKTSPEDRAQAYAKLRKLPRNSAHNLRASAQCATTKIAN